MEVLIIVYSHLSNKREVTLTNFEKFHPPQKNPPSTFIDFLDFFHPPLLHYLLQLYTSFFQKNPTLMFILTSTFIPTSTFIDFETFALPLRLYQPPWLLMR